MASYSSRAYMVGSDDLRDRLIAELAVAGIPAVAGDGVQLAAWAKADYSPRLVFVRGEPIPDGIMPRALRRCQNHRDRNEAMTMRGPTLDGNAKLCAECRDARISQIRGDPEAGSCTIPR
jgi:hypothetical protein